MGQVVACVRACVGGIKRVNILMCYCLFVLSLFWVEPGGESLTSSDVASAIRSAGNSPRSTTFRDKGWGRGGVEGWVGWGGEIHLGECQQTRKQTHTVWWR